MPNAKAHAAIGGSVGGLAYLVWKRLNNEDPTLEGFLASLVGGAGAGLLPDMLEPAIHPNHRKFFHSLAAAGILGAGAKNVLENPDLVRDDKLAYLVFLLGYGSHLAADATTPAGLPPV